MIGSDWIWSCKYIVKVIENNNDIDEMVEQVEKDHQEDFDEWKNEDLDMYESMIDLTKEQIETLDNFN